jgi:hypothetical protein
MDGVLVTSSKIPAVTRRILSEHPVAAEFHPTLNGALTSNQVPYSSGNNLVAVFCGSHARMGGVTEQQDEEEQANGLRSLLRELAEGQSPV